MEMKDFMSVTEGSEGILGKIFYYSLNGLLIKKETLKRIGNEMGLPKVCPSREAKASAYHKATGALRERIVSKSGSGLRIMSVYCRNNRNDDAKLLSRELIKETVRQQTNEYQKLANIVYNPKDDKVGYWYDQSETEVDVLKYCNQAVALFELYRICYDTAQVDTVIKSQLESMEAVKISVKGNLYFIPKRYLTELSVLEDYIEAVGRSKEESLSNSIVCCNSMFVVDDAKQRQKMTDEFYNNFRSTLADYQDRIQHFIDNGCTSKAVIDRWVKKISSLTDLKRTYETTFQTQLSALNDSQAMLDMQVSELQKRAESQEQDPLDNLVA